MSRNLFRLSAGVIVAGFSVGALFVHSLKPASAQAAPPSPKDLYGEKCSACHNLPDPVAEAQTAAQWRATVNRMLFQHGASDSISTDQANTIVAYLTTFAVAPKPGGQGGMNGGDVFPSDPIYSHVYRFMTPEILAPFRNISAKATVYDSSVGPLLAFATTPGGNAAVIEAPTPGMHGFLSETAEFRAAVPSADTTAPAPPPVSFGLTFDTHDATNYYVAAYDDTQHQLNLIQVQNGQQNVIKSVPMTSGLAASPDGWHKMKLNVADGRVKVWLDFSKQIDVPLTSALTGGGAGIWTNSKACVRMYILDVYPTNPLNVAT